MQKIFPIVSDLKGYHKGHFKLDMIAGITVAIMLVPQAMAYAYLAGMPPIYGLYASLVPTFLYALLGTSQQMSVGPVAVSALLVLSGVGQIAEPGSQTYIRLVITTGLLVGLMQLLFSLFKLGFLVNFLSHPVISGFTSAAAIIIIINQIKDLIGVDIPRSVHVYETFLYDLRLIGETNYLALSLSIASVLVLIILRRINRLIPAALIVVVVATVLCGWFQWQEEQGLAIVNTVPAGLPAFQTPSLNYATFLQLLPTVFTVTAIGIVESYGIAKTIERQHQNYVVRPNQELLALGISKVAGSFFQAIPTSGSFSRSAVNNAVGAQTGVASIITALIVLLTLLFFTPLFYYLPKAVLAAIILISAVGLFDYKEGWYLWKTHRRDFRLMLITFSLTLLLGIELGVLVGVILSVLTVLYKSSRPHLAVLGKVPNTTYYRNIKRFPDIKRNPEMLIVRFDNQLFFGNATFFKDTIKDLLITDGMRAKVLFIDAKSMHDIDSSGLHVLNELYNWLARNQIDVYFTSAIGPVRDLIIKSGLYEKIGSEHHFMYLHDAIEDYEERKED